jgi:nicotinamide-nucleotide amidase
MRVDVKELHAALIRSGKTLALAESCTGGAIAARLTAIPGASKFFLGSMVVYSRSWKESFLDVEAESVSLKGAIEMAEGLFEKTEADLVASVTGIAGPGGGTTHTPVGTIFIAVGMRGSPIEAKRLMAPQERAAAIEFAVDEVLAAIRRLV